jgi:hypothetical protein
MVRPLAEVDVRTEAAYCLFYRRKDIATKKISDIIPYMNETKFVGMPIKTKYGVNGYLLEYREGHKCPYVVGLNGSTIMYLSKNDILKFPQEVATPNQRNARMSQMKKEGLLKREEQVPKKA